MPPRTRRQKAIAATAAGPFPQVNNPSPPSPERGAERFAPWIALFNSVATPRPATPNQQPPVAVPLTRYNLDLLNQESTARFPQAPFPADSSVVSSRHQPKTATCDNNAVTVFATTQHANGILDPTKSTAPLNLDAIRKRLQVQHADSPPGGSMYHCYRRNIRAAQNLATVTYEVSMLLRRYPDDLAYRTTVNGTFDGFPDDAAFNEGMPPPDASFVQGYEIDEFAPLQIEFLRAAVAFRDNTHSVTLPQMAGEFAGRERSLELSRLRSAHTGAALVYGRTRACTFANKEDAVGHAEIVTFTTDGDTLTFFAHYSTKSPDGAVWYQQYPVVSANLIASHADFMLGWTMIQNCQDYARLISQKLRDELLDQYAKYGPGAWQLYLRMDEREKLLSDSPMTGGGSQGPAQPPKRRRGRPRIRKPSGAGNAALVANTTGVAGPSGNPAGSAGPASSTAPRARYTAKRTGKYKFMCTRNPNGS